MTHASDPTKAHTPLTALLEIKGVDSPQDQAKRAALAQWVQAVNEHGGFGTWAWDVVVGDAAGLRDVIDAHGPGIQPAAAQA
jgi:type III restriction enzyme